MSLPRTPKQIEAFMFAFSTQLDDEQMDAAFCALVVALCIRNDLAPTELFERLGETSDEYDIFCASIDRYKAWYAQVFESAKRDRSHFLDMIPGPHYARQSLVSTSTTRGRPA